MSSTSWTTRHAPTSSRSSTSSSRSSPSSRRKSSATTVPRHPSHLNLPYPLSDYGPCSPLLWPNHCPRHRDDLVRVATKVDQLKPSRPFASCQSSPYTKRSLDLPANPDPFLHRYITHNYTQARCSLPPSLTYAYQIAQGRILSPRSGNPITTNIDRECIANVPVRPGQMESTLEKQQVHRPPSPSSSWHRVHWAHHLLPTQRPPSLHPNPSLQSAPTRRQDTLRRLYTGSTTSQWNYRHERTTSAISSTAVE